MPLKKTILKIHSWLGLLSGLVVFILGITGCIYVFMEEIKPLVYHQRLFVEVPDHTQRLPIAVITAKAQAAIGTAYPLQLAEVPQAANRSFMFRAVKTNPEALSYATYMEYFYRVYVNPYNGEILKVEHTKWEFFNTVVNLHINLLLGPKIGGTIVNWSVIIFVVILISGIVLWWPSGKAAAKQRFRFRWKKDTKWKRKNYDLHNILGFYAMLVLLIIALTGLVISYPWFSNAVQWLGNGGKKTMAPPAVLADSLATQVLTLDHIIVNATNSVPPGSTLLVTLPKDPNTVVSVFARRDGKPLYNAIRMKFDQHTAAPLWRRSFADMPGGERLQAMNYDIHVGAVLGLPGKMLAFLASLIAASLPVTGFYIWWGRKNKKKSAYNSRTMPQQQRA